MLVQRIGAQEALWNRGFSFRPAAADIGGLPPSPRPPHSEGIVAGGKLEAATA
jgi:hypothetical protein